MYTDMIKLHRIKAKVGPRERVEYVNEDHIVSIAACGEVTNVYLSTGGYIIVSDSVEEILTQIEVT